MIRQLGNTFKKKLFGLILLSFSIASCVSSQGEELASKTVPAREILDLLEKKQPVVVRDCVVEGDLDFTGIGNPVPLSPGLQQLQVLSPVYFEGCHFTGNVRGVNFNMEIPVTCAFSYPVTFYQCQFDEEFDFSGAVFGGPLNLTKSYFEKEVRLQAIRVAADLRFEEAVFNKDFLMQEATVGGTAWGKDATFLGRFSAQQSDFWQHVVLTGISVHGYTDMSLVNFRRSAFFGYGNYYDRVIYSGARFSERAEWTNAVYTRTVSFDTAKFAGVTELSGLDAREGLSAIDTRFEGGVPLGMTGRPAAHKRRRPVQR